MKPGFAIAEITNVYQKIKAREERIAHLEHEMHCIQDKIDIMKHEIEEFKKMENKDGNKKD
jgi:peptidoglycan hydrolase CwlO-like protein